MHRSSPSIASLAAALAKAQAELVNPEKSLTATIASGPYLKRTGSPRPMPSVSKRASKQGWRTLRLPLHPNLTGRGTPRSCRLSMASIRLSRGSGRAPRDLKKPR